MKRNTLLVTMMVGIGAVVAMYSVLTTANKPQYQSRNTNLESAPTEKNNDFFDMMHRNVNTGKVEPDDFIRARQSVRAQRGASGTLGLTWDFVGPDNIGGLTRGIVVDNQDNKRIYAGADGGGFFVSTDGGGTWTYKSVDWDNINVSAVAQAPDGRIYVGTGPGLYDLTVGGGIYVSDDRGETFSVLSSTVPASVGSGWTYINRITVSKSKNSQGNYTVYAGTNKGLYVSVDKGITWTQPLTAPNCVTPLTGQVQDIVISKSGRVFVALSSRFYYSDDGETACTYNKVVEAGGGSRMTIAACPSDENIVYVYVATDSPRDFIVNKSTDGGVTWAPLQPAPPSTVIDTTFNLLGFNPVAYNQALVVDPSNCDYIYVGAVDMYRVSGSWSSVAVNFRGATGFYVHADKHWFMYDPTNPKTMYVGTDGGIGKTQNADETVVFWTENNRHYNTVQYYDVSTSPTGQVIGGSQDNGNHVIDPGLPGVSGVDGRYLWTLGDGFDCEASMLSSFTFVTSQYGNVGRDSYLPSSKSGVMIHQGGNPGTGGVAPFKTILGLWESKNDLSSKDSIVLKNDSVVQRLDLGDGNVQIMHGTLLKPQEAAKFVAGSVRIVDVVGGQEATDAAQPGILRSFGDSVGTIDYATGKYSVRWNFPPPLNSTIIGIFSVSYDAGDTLYLKSKNADYPFSYVLTAPITVGDSVVVQDPIQSLLAVSMNDGVDITREALRKETTPKWMRISTIVPTAFEFSKDGNHLYVGGGNGQVVRISGLKDFYVGADEDLVLTKTVIFTSQAPVSGLALNPTDQNTLLITTGGFGSADHVFELSNAQNATNSATAGKRSVQGNLADFPVFDAEYNVNHPTQVLLGTEYGVWATDNISASNPVWSHESSNVGNVQVTDVVQQKLPFNEATNYGQFYLATYGRGLWTSTDLVSVDDEQFDDFSNIEIQSLSLYPNPVHIYGTVKFDMPVNGVAEITIFDISGKVVSRRINNYAKGEVNFVFSVASMPAGTYFMSVRVGYSQKHTKFVVVK